MREERLRGYHWHGGGRGIRRSMGDIERFLDEAIALTGLKELRRAVDLEGGVGFALIAESHISVHIREDRAWVDIFSCREVRAWEAEQVAIGIWGGYWNSRLIRRDL